MIFRSVKEAIGSILRLPFIKRILIEVPVVNQAYQAVERTHPFDRVYKVDTSGFLTADKIQPDRASKEVVFPYSASQASIIRSALSALGDVSGDNFVDLGCGKGRATLVATEFLFRQIEGVELSPTLASVARQNAARFATSFPDRRKVTIHTANARDYAFPRGRLVVFMYHSFPRLVLGEILTKLEMSLAADHNTHAFVIYYNPVFWQGLDASPAFERWFAKTIDYDQSEIGFGPDKFDTVVIWQSKREATTSAHVERDAQIVEMYPESKVALASATRSV